MKARLTLMALLFSSSMMAQGETPPPPAPVTNVNTVGAGESETGKSKDLIVDFPDIEAEFPGGATAMKKFIQRNVLYPEIAREKGIQGRVYVYFIVERNGKVTSPSTGGTSHELLNAEAIRLVQQMPKWKPAKENGKRVRSRCRLPITFTLT